MVKTIYKGFQEFLLQISPSSTEFKTHQIHIATIEDCIRENFGLSRLFLTGSFGNGTSISGYSDIDYFACIHVEKLSQSSEVLLNQVCNTLAKRFSKFKVYVDCPAVKICFGVDTKETTEIVPAQYLKQTSSGYFIYVIPDCLNSWMKASPEIHDAYVLKIDQSLDHQVKPLIRFIKAWKYYHQIPISSFYLELGVTKYVKGKRLIVYDRDIKHFFSYLYNFKLSAIHDPVNISGSIVPCSTQVELSNILSKLSTAVSFSEKALEAKEKGNLEEAFNWWNLLYNGQFPSYYI